MAFLQLFIFPFVFLVTLPLALCAGFTTILAFLVLFLRLFLVYFDVGLETLRYIMLGGSAAHNRYISSQRPGSPSASPQSSPELRTTTTTRRRSGARKRNNSSVSSGTLTPIGSLDGLALTPSTGLGRDFEGLGGWRLDSLAGGADAETPEDLQWTNLNSRLEMPYRRHHYRSQSGAAILSGASGFGLYSSKAGTRRGSHSPGEFKVATPPAGYRSRTPSGSKALEFTKLDENEYFALLEGKLKKASI
ncbi:hypothetical protein F5B20DRAFT_561846 [Whalleya microplaca]|nr:hypothetical protein F5B20DRAFT_561846 [Whalleya microplaca]